MSIVVQKFGGSSLVDERHMRRCAHRAAAAARGGLPVVVVVSAMGRRTDELIRQARNAARAAPSRELDALLATGEQASAALMAMTLADLGVEALSVSGDALGIVTDRSHGEAEIRDVRPTRIVRELEAGRVVVAPGFIGRTECGSITTLGRGGSDITAVVLAAALGADDGGICEIHTDVDGIHSADPRLVPEAQLLRTIPYAAMHELAAHGASVLHPRAVHWASRHRVPVRVRSSLRAGPGTRLVGTECERAGAVGVLGCAMRREGELDRISAVGVALERGPTMPSSLRRALEACEIEIVRAERTSTRISVLVPAGRGDAGLRAMHAALGLGSVARGRTPAAALAEPAA